MNFKPTPYTMVKCVKCELMNKVPYDENASSVSSSVSSSFNPSSTASYPYNNAPSSNYNNAPSSNYNNTPSSNNAPSSLSYTAPFSYKWEKELTALMNLNLCSDPKIWMKVLGT